MKRPPFILHFVFSLFLIFLHPLFLSAQNNDLYGIWESKDRYVFFEKNDSQNEIIIYLKTYYGWYIDRTAEPQDYDEKVKRTRNVATPKKAEHVFYDIQEISKAETKSEVFELNLQYSKKDSAKIPVAILDGKMYLNFYIRDSEDENFYRGNAVSSGIKISPQKNAENLSCLYFDGDSFFDIRYWFTDMDYEDSKVQLNFGEKSFSVDRHIFSGGRNFSCVSGRSKKLRNVVEPFSFADKENVFFNDDKSVLIFDEEPYLVKLADKNDFDDLMEIVRTANSKRKPQPPAIFPPNNLDWHWDLIDFIEKDDKMIQQVRARQKEFGPRAKDFQK